MFRTNNPVMKADIFERPQTWGDFLGEKARPNTMTLNGTVIKSMVLLAICAITAIFAWQLIQSEPSSRMALGLGGCLGGVVVGLIITFRPKTAPVLSPIYAILEGCFIAAASYFWASYAAGSKGTAGMLGTNIILQAGLLTFGISAAMLTAYATRIVRPSQKVMGAIAAITGGMFIFSLLAMIVSFFSPGFMMSMWQSPMGIAFAGFIVVLAAANLVLDFAMVEDGVKNGAPKYMEWYAGFGLLVTLVWLYISILRLLALLSRRE